MTTYTYNTIQVKKMNIELVKNALKAQGIATKASIAGLTKLSDATCGTILNELLAKGEVIQRMEKSIGKFNKSLRHAAGKHFYWIRYLRVFGKY